MNAAGVPADRAEWAAQAAALVLTTAFVTLAVLAPIAPPPPAVDARKSAQVTLSVVEEAPPTPPQAAPPPEPEPPPLPPQAAPSPVLTPPPPGPRRIVHPRHPIPPRPVLQQETAAPQPEQRTPAAIAPPQHAPENHSAEGAYIGRLHAIVARNTTPPSSPAHRLSHPSGEVEIGFTLSRTGRISGLHIIRPSGSALLDQQALRIVASQPYPLIPNDVYPADATHAFSVPVSFPDTGAADGL